MSMIRVRSIGRTARFGRVNVGSGPAPGAKFDAFLALLNEHGLPAPQTEFRFHPIRRWLADYCWPHAMLIVERDGGIWRGGKGGGSARGGHSSGVGIVRDMEKSNAAQLLGYVYLRFQPRELDKGSALDTIKQILVGQ